MNLGSVYTAIFFLLSFFLLILVQCIDIPNNTACVIASKAADGSYDFNLEEDASMFYEAQRKKLNFEIPAAVWFNNSIDTLGFAFQTVKTSGDIDDTIQAYWAGYLESHISLDLTKAHFENTCSGFCEDATSSSCAQLKEALTRNLELSIKRSLQSGDIDCYWHQMELILWQLRGLIDGWKGVTITNSKLLTPDYLFKLVDSVFDIYLLQLSGDLSEISQALGVGDVLKGKLSTLKYPLYPPSCSALIKVLPGQEDIYISQITWQGYSSMLKVIKYYEFAWKLTRQPDAPLIPAQQMIFSSYPSTVASLDDYYTTGSGLAVLETTNGNSNPVLWPHVRHGLNTSVLEVFRVMIANRLARTPSEWISYFSRENSGTYNNQWMIFDSKKFVPNKPLPKKDLLWVAEQIPGLVMSADVTDHLINKSYWASYNNPYFEYIFNISGGRENVNRYGDWFDYDKNPRAKIFKRDQEAVDSLGAMFRLMRYNNFKEDPLAKCNCTPPYSAENAIAARSDLNDPNGTYPFSALQYRLHGATDVKLVNFNMIKQMSIVAVSGPTYDQVPMFEWSKTNPAVPKPKMHPDRWNFPPLYVEVENYEGAWRQPYLKSHLISHG